MLSYLKKQGYAEVLQEDELTKETFIKSVHTLTARKSEMTATMEKTQRPKTPNEMAKLILQFKKNKKKLCVLARDRIHSFFSLEKWGIFITSLVLRLLAVDGQLSGRTDHAEFYIK